MTSQVWVQQVGFTVAENCAYTKQIYTPAYGIVLLRYFCAFIGSASYSPELWMNFVVSCKGDISANWGCYSNISPSVFIHKYWSEGYVEVVIYICAQWHVSKHSQIPEIAYRSLMACSHKHNNTQPASKVSLSTFTNRTAPHSQEQIKAMWEILMKLPCK